MDRYHGHPRLSGQATWQPPSPADLPVPQKSFYEHSAVPLSVQRERGSRAQDFRPFAHRTFPLLVLVITVLGLIGALEYGMRALPQATGGKTLGARDLADGASVGKRSGFGVPDLFRFEKRQAVIQNPSTSGTFTFQDFPEVTKTSVGTSIAAKSDYSDGKAPATTIKPTITVASSSYLRNGAAQTVTSQGPTPTVIGRTRSTSSTSSYSSISLGHPPPTSYLPIGTLQTTLTIDLHGSRTSSGSVPSITLPAGVKDSSVPLTSAQAPHNYFLAIYLPVLIAVSVRLFSGYLYRSTRLMDPFFMLSQSEGTPASDFLRADHLGGDSVLAPYHALRSRRWLLLWTTLIYAAAQLLTPLASELALIYPSNHTSAVPNALIMVRGYAFWINTAIGRLIQGLLTFIAIMIILVWFMLRRHRSGISANPSSIGAIASLVDHTATTNDIAAIDQGGSKKSVDRALSSRRYKLGYYVSNDGAERYGIVPIEVIFDDGRNTEYAGPAPFMHHPGRGDFQHSTTDPGSPQSSKSGSSAVFKRILPLGVLTATSVALFGVILAYSLNSDPTDFEKFISSDSFGPRFVLSVLGMLVKSPLLALCAKATAAVPLARLAEGPRAAGRDLLSPVPLTPQGTIWYSLRRGQWYAAGLAVAAGVLVEVMLVLLPGVPFSTTQLYLAANVSWYGCLGCLAVFILVAAAGWVRLVLQRTRRTRRREQRRCFPQIIDPARIGTVCACVAGSRMAADFASSLAAAELSVPAGGDVAAIWRRDIRSWGAKYDFAPRAGGRWLIDYADGRYDDEERNHLHSPPLDHEYVPGYDQADSRMDQAVFRPD